MVGRNLDWCDSCAKRIFRTEDEAKDTAEYIRYTGGYKLSVYKCPLGGYHLTKDDKNNFGEVLERAGSK